MVFHLAHSAQRQLYEGEEQEQSQEAALWAAHTGMPQQLELHQGMLALLVPADGEGGGRCKDGGQAVIWALYFVAG